MRAVVFGGSGFLGSHVADELTSRGYDVVVFDLNASRYLREGQTMVRGDIRDRDAVMTVCSGADFVYNFAGIADLDDASTKPIETVELNVIGNLNVIEGVLAAGAKRFVYASSLYVYSQKGGFYRCSKQASELYIEEYARRDGLEFTILRFGTLYGPRAGGSNSIRRYLLSAQECGHITVSGTGEEMREYINVHDAAVLSVDILDPAYRNEHVIITGQHPIKFKEMLYVIREILGRPDMEIEFTGGTYSEHYSYTPYSYAPSIGRKLVNNPYTDIGQGLLECLEDMNAPAPGQVEEDSGGEVG